MHKNPYLGQMSTKRRVGVRTPFWNQRGRRGTAPKSGRLQGFGPLRSRVGDPRRDAHYSTPCRTTRGVKYSCPGGAIR